MILPIDHKRPLADQVYALLARAIRAGELRAGERLPPSRRLASSNGLSRNTVVAAYQQLAAEGYVETRRAGGTRVAPDLPRTVLDRAARAPSSPRPGRVPGRIPATGRLVLKHAEVFAPLTRAERPGLPWDFDYNVSVADATSRAAWARLTRRLARRHETDPPPWNPTRRPVALHAQIERHLRLARGVRCDAGQLILLPSQQAAFRLVAQLLVEPGDLVALEDPHYLGARSTFLAGGARIAPIPVDARGLRTDLLPRDAGTRLVYTAPSHQWPTGVSLPLGRRLELLRWARRERAWIVENDHNCEYLYEGTPVQSVQGLDEDGRVIHVGTFSRLLDPYPSIAYAVVPGALADLFRAGANLAGLVLPALESETLAEFIRGGHMEKLLRRASRRMRPLRRVLLEALRDLPAPVDVQTSTGGLHLYVRMPGWTEEDVADLAARAQAVGVGIYPGAPFHMHRPDSPGFLLGFAWRTPAQITEGVRRLARLVEERRPA